MAWFRRKRDDAPDVEEAAPAQADAGDVVRASRSQAGDWMAMPPIHTTVGPPPSTFKVQRVSEIMTTRRPMAFMGQLGHQVSSSAPSGHVEGLTTTVAPPTAAPHPIDLPLHGRAPHHEEHEQPAPAIASTPSPAPDEPAVQRSVRDLPPGEPVTAQTLGVLRQAMPTVQRALSASPAAPAVASTPSRPALPEPSPSRVLREPTRPASPLESRVPTLPVVVAPSTSAGPEPEEFVVPDRAVEFTVESSGPPDLTPAADAPLAGSLPLQRRVESDAGDVVTPARTDPAAPDLPLAAPAAAAPSGANPTTPTTAAVSGELMPPIQPRAVQRRAAEAAAAPKPAPAPEPPAATADDLPPLPAWARESIGLPPTAPADEAREVPAADMPLVAPTTRATDAPPTPSPATDIDTPTEPDGGLAPLAGAGPELGTPVARSSEASPGSGEPPASLELPLHTAPAPAASGTAPVQREADPVAATASPVEVQRTAEDAGHGQPGHVHTDDDDDAPVDEGPSSVAPLLGDRPLQLQRLGTEPGIASFEPPAGPSALPLPLVADVAGGPALPPVRDPSAPSAPPASNVPHAANAPSGSQASSATAGGTRPSTSPTRALAVPLQRSAAVSAPTAAAPAASGPTGPTGLPLRSLSTGPGSAPGFPLPTPAAAGDAGATVLTRADSSSTDAQPLPLVAVQTQRDAAPSMPLHEPSRPSAAAAAATATVLREAIQNGSGFYDAEGNVVLSGPGADAGAAAGTTNGMAVQRSATTVSDIVVQRAETTADGGSPTAVSPSPDGDDKQLDEMAAKVYDRIRWKLVSEMRVDERRLGAGHWNRKGR